MFSLSGNGRTLATRTAEDVLTKERVKRKESRRNAANGGTDGTAREWEQRTDEQGETGGERRRGRERREGGRKMEKERESEDERRHSRKRES